MEVLTRKYKIERKVRYRSHKVWERTSDGGNRIHFFLYFTTSSPNIRHLFRVNPKFRVQLDIKLIDLGKELQTGKFKIEITVRYRPCSL